MSTLRTIPGDEVAVDRLGALDPLEVLVDVDGPRLFVARSPAGDDLLVYQWAEGQAQLGWVAVPTDARTVEGVRGGQLALLEALRQPWTWLVTQAFDGTIERVQRVRLDDLPAGSLPAPGVTLVPAEEPFLAVRATGAALSAREVPASVVRRVVDGAMHTMKTLIERVLEVTAPEGRPTDRLRRYYDLPTRRLAFGSFEAVFGEPATPALQPLLRDEQDALDRAGQLLQRGIAEVQRLPVADEPMAPDEDLETALDALAGLLPPASGLIEEVHLRGRLVGSAPVRFGREHGARARLMLRRMRPSLVPLVVQGAVRELDKDALTFIVRSPDLTQAWPCRYSPAQRDDVYAAFAEEYQVAISGHQRAGRLHLEVLAVDPID